MQYFIGLATVLFLFSCGNREETDSIEQENESDSTSIVEYNMDENRLSAVDYNNKLSLMQQRVLEQVDILFMSDTGDVEINHENARFEIEMNINDLELTHVPEGGEQFKVALFNLLTFYQTELDQEFKEMIPLLKKIELSDGEADQLDVYSNKFAEKEEEFFEIMLLEQEKFAEGNNFGIQ